MMGTVDMARHWLRGGASGGSSSILGELRQAVCKFEELRAYSLLWHPHVVWDRVRFKREKATRPLVMRSIPSSIEIEVTNRCNLACVQCLRSRGLKPYALGDMSLETFAEILKQFPRLLHLSLNGFGEPLVHPRFFDFVAYARDVLPWAKIDIYSNGTLLDAAAADAAMQTGLTEIDVSIDAANPETYRRVRRGGHLETVHSNLRALLRRRAEAAKRWPIVGVNFVMLNENEGELVPFLEQASDLGVDLVNCVSLATYDWGFSNRRSETSYRKEIDAARRRIDDLGLRCRVLPSIDFSWTDPDRALSCDFFWGGSVRITFEGEMMLGCCTPFKETFSYGNVCRTPFTEIWNNEVMRASRAVARLHESPNAVCTRCAVASSRFFSPMEQPDARRLRVM